ncbi:methyltransferase [Paramagnetospirillum marisnigri]|uniref:Methyltransferase n=1 Tax=Paramagnetospirillum marisnigri TaxID=1285242 RepID=A0A178MIM1_9PROT|nr:tetratricopeptide repeat protein [Paramagnetospirillum marisnigri]OAN47978.1 methyltransferase [Paramagnetospirillum marisnigri]
MARQFSLSVSDAFAQAMRTWESGNATEARRLARLIADANPGFGGAHYLLGAIALSQGQARKASEHLSRAVAADPNQSVPRLALGRALEAQNSLNAAIVQYRAVLITEPDHAEAHARLAALLARTGKASQALDHGRHAIAVNPNHAEALCALGALLHQQGEDREARGYLERALALRPDWGVALHNYGLVLRRLGEAERAAALLSGAVDLRRDHAATRANLAGALREMGRLDEARIQAEQAAKLAPRDAVGWMELGLIRNAQGMPEGAAAAFERAVTAEPDSVDAHWCLAEARRLLGETAKATAHYRRCLELDPDDTHGAALGLALTGGAPVPQRAPDAYVRQLFDDYAETFDSALVNRLGYRAPALLAEALERDLVRKTGLAVLDAGCGTGLAAPVLRPLAGRLDGIDLSPAMVDKARARGLYDDLAVGELGAALTTRPATYDLIVAADVLVYFGDLEPVLHAGFAALRPGGIFAFTVERAEDCSSYLLGAKNRYAHAEDYVAAKAQVAGFALARMDHAVTRREAEAEVPGLVVILRRP